MRRTKIICTIGPSSRSPQVLRQLIRFGMDVARLNFSHGDLDSHEENVSRIRAAAREERKSVAILVDLQGPKFRLGDLIEEGIHIKEGDEITFTAKGLLGRSKDAIPVQNKNLPALLSTGDKILIDDGLMEVKTLSIKDDQITGQVEVGGRLKSNKGMNLPGISADLPAMTEKDRHYLTQALKWDVDWVALSFVRSPSDMEILRKFIRTQTDRNIPVMAKIEKPEALHNIEEIIETSDGIMVARGDLGIEIPAEKVPMAQKRIIERCNQEGIPVVTATQMLDSMIRNPRPTRAEASDVANALLDGTDAVMLSGETTIGRYPVGSLKTMVKIIGEVEETRPQISGMPFRPLEEDINLSIARAVGRAARDAAQHLDIAAILAVTASGYTARIVSRFRPKAPIIAITPSKRVQRQLKLYWGVSPILAPRTENTDIMIDNALEAVKERGWVKEGDLLAITAGTAGSEPGTTNLMRIQIV